MAEINTAMFRRIHDQITAHPETHDQGVFESRCGTTRCIAGWAIHFAAVDRADGSDQYGMPYKINKYWQAKGEDNLPLYDITETTAADILGMPFDAAHGLFYTMDDELAVDYVAELATGSIPTDLLEG